MGIGLERDRWTVLREAKETENTWKVEVHAAQGSIREHFKGGCKQAFQGRRGHWKTHHSIRIFSSEHSLLLTSVSTCMRVCQETHSSVVCWGKQGAWITTSPHKRSCAHSGDLANTHSSRLQGHGPLDSGVGRGLSHKESIAALWNGGKCPSNSVAMR